MKGPKSLSLAVFGHDTAQPGDHARPGRREGKHFCCPLARPPAPVSAGGRSPRGRGFEGVGGMYVCV